MMLFLTLVGILLALVIFLNGMQAAEKTRKPLKNDEPGDRSVLDVKKVLKMPPGELRPRICPVCGTMLGPRDYLIAALEPEPKTDRKRQAHIYGCPFCFESGGVNTTRRQLTHIEP